MVELVKYMITELVDDKDAVVVTLAEDEEGTINVKVAQNDMGKIIGKEGRIAKAIRTIVKAASARSDIKYSVVILENE